MLPITWEARPLPVSALIAQRGHGANLAGIHTTHMPACCLSPPSPITHNCPRLASSDTQHAGSLQSPILQPSQDSALYCRTVALCPLTHPALFCPTRKKQQSHVHWKPHSCWPCPPLAVCLSAEKFTGDLKRQNMNYVYYISKTILECNSRMTVYCRTIMRRTTGSVQILIRYWKRQELSKENSYMMH